MSMAPQKAEEVRVDWRKVEFDVRSERAKVAHAIGSSAASLVTRIFKAPAGLLGGRVSTDLRA